MGYARVFWIQEKPIREYISANGSDDAITEEIGKRILAFSAKDTGGLLDRDTPTSLPLFNTPSVLFPFQYSFHSTGFIVLIWTGNRLCALRKPSLSMFDSLCQLTSTVGTSHTVLSISEAGYSRAIAGGEWQNQLEQSMWTSLYWIHEDFSRDFERVPEVDWPCKEVGVAALDLMLSNWKSSAGILYHGNALKKCCSFTQPEFAVIVWSLNCLRLLSQIDDDEIQRMREYIGRST